ncbi:MAG TPA: DUF6049 family protein [Acidimicrobiia bacterium]|nr:DUF6049 family protein [Acidimicrobiia bacterium]
MTSRARRFGGVVAAAALATAGIGIPTQAFIGVAGAAGAPRAAVSLISQPAWTELGGTLALGLRFDGDISGLDVRVISHRAITSRIDFEETVGGKRLGGTLATVEVPAGAVPAGPDGPFLELPLTATGAGGSAPGLSINRNGVYPLEIDLVDPDGNSVNGFVTHVVAVPPTAPGASAIGSPLEVAWVWPMAEPPAYRPSGKTDRDVVEELGPLGRVGEIAAALADAEGVPLTLAPGPETVESWAVIEADKPVIGPGLAALRSASLSNQTLRGPYVPLNAQALDAAGLGAQVAPEYAAGADALNGTLDVRVDPRTAVASPVSPATLARMWELNTDRVIIEPDALVGVSNKFTPAAPVMLMSEGHAFTAAVADAQLAELLTGDAPVALRAQWFLSGLAVIANELPNLTRGVVVLPDPSWDPPEALLTTVLAGLRGNPLVRPVDIDTFFDTVPIAEDDTVRELATPQTQPPLAVTQTRYREAESQLTALRNLVGREDPRVRAGKRALLVSLSSAWRGAAGIRRANAELAIIDRSLGDLVHGVAVPERRTLTITAREAEIPVSFQNNTGQPVRVEVTLTSDKLLFPDGSSQILDLPPRNTTARFAVEARASGTFPLTLEVTSPDGRVIFSRSQITVRSAVVSNVGVILTVGAIAFLAIWWLNHARRRRRVRAQTTGAVVGPISTE